MSKGLKVYNTGYTVKDIPDLTGKIAIVTGGNSGIGFETCLELARKGALVYMASRSEARAVEAIDKIKAQVPEAKIEFLKLDLQDLKQVKSSAETFLSKHSTLDILINNAGIMACPFGLTKDGIESQFGTNHVGHFLFTNTLLPSIIKSGKGSRIVNVASSAHELAPPTGVNYEALENGDDKAMNTAQRYGVSKLSNILFTRELSKRVAKNGIYVNCVHPGVVRTELLQGVASFFGTGFLKSAFQMSMKIISYPFTIDSPRGALTTLYCATSPEIVEMDIHASFYYPIAKLANENLTETAKSEKDDLKLWEFTENLIKKALEA